MRITIHDRNEQDVHFGLQRVHVTTGNKVVNYNVYIRTPPYNDVCRIYSHHDRTYRDRWGDTHTTFVTRKVPLDSPLGHAIAATVNGTLPPRGAS